MKHRVAAKMRDLEISKAGSAIELRLYADNDTDVEVLGTIQIGHGSFGWRGRKKKTFKKYSWTRFAELMDKLDKKS